ncbi:hypothetical protein QCA50_012689 [Cerrena zonata]|uniref:SPX domain-containing protein n=1 Tax=Cerrena zonata TaxID=2478898 RepID=A0AAW0FXM2_9APHY
MKFGESLSDGLVPEWKDQYLNYKQGKKLIKKLTQLKNDIEIEDSQENPDDLIDYYAGEQSQELLQLNGKRLANEGTPLLTPSDEDPQKGKGRNDETWSHINLADSSNSDSNDQNVSSSSHNKHIVHPIESDSNSDHGNDQGDQKQNSTRRQSIFNYSLKSSKDKKESFYTEKKKFFNWLDSELEANPISAGKNDEDLTISRPPTGQMSRYSKASGVSAHPSHVTFGDEEADLGLSEITQNAELSNLERINNKLPSAVPKLTRRKSTIMNISDVLNKAHIKDFQRKKKPVIEENDDSDDEDEDDVDEHSRHASINTPAGVPAGTNY